MRKTCKRPRPRTSGKPKAASVDPKNALGEAFLRALPPEAREAIMRRVKDQFEAEFRARGILAPNQRLQWVGLNQLVPVADGPEDAKKGDPDPTCN